MATKKQTAQVLGNRQAAYTARNKARLIKDAQEVLAEIGPSATIEQLAAHAEVSPTTIYKYFQNKDELFLTAFNDLWKEFLKHSSEHASPGDPFERLLDVGRKLFRVKQSHPLFAKVLHNSVSEISNYLIDADKGEGKEVFRRFAASGVIKKEDFDERWILWTNIVSGLLVSVHVKEELSPEEADLAYGIGLSVWGLSEAKAKKIISRPLAFPLHAIG
jgi:AcrR family transcriptional regulator